MDESSPQYTKITEYLDKNPAAVLSTVDDNNRPHGAVVYVCMASHHTVCFVTKSETKKYKNLIKHPDVSLTFMNERDRNTLQAVGQARVVEDKDLLDYVMNKVKDAHVMQAEWLPPISELYAGEYAVIGVELSYARLGEFQGANLTNDQIFTEIGQKPLD
jgi:uncharacterized pyridoxamine 5'-phosphate oxidase family protein